MKTFADLKTGTIVRYNDQSNRDLDFVILDTYTDQFGTWVNFMNLKTRMIETHSAITEIGRNWKELEPVRFLTDQEVGENEELLDAMADFDEDAENRFNECMRVIKNIEKIGYTADFGLSGELCDFKKL